MNWLPPSELILYTANTVATAGVAARVFALDLHRKYRFFTAWLCWCLIQAAIIFSVTSSAHWYLRAYVTTELVSMALTLCVVLEVYSVVLAQVPGISHVAGVIIRGAVIAGVLGAAGLFCLEQRPKELVGVILLLKRTAYSSALFFVVLVTIFLLWYPVRASRNTISYSIGFAVYLSSETALLLVYNMGHPDRRVVSPVLSAISVACLAYWLVGLRPERDEAPGPAPVDRSEGERLLQRMQRIARRVSSRDPYN